ncbi:MAG: hypothetical protein EOR04_13545 [Mesorhizobium sp.]|uniref:TauD/TfdA family dioxygenase n=2 Tax=Phyllobacteriaceae TaxID=69277 RepID=UPI000FEA11F9|nr:MAG: hypothetical protein EOR04_13545 [Mesorhizobium sp.]
MSALAEGLCAVGWATTSVVGDEATVISAIASVGDQLGKRVHGRGSAEIELIVPTPHDLAHPRSLSAHHDLGLLPLHVELSHRMRPCRYVVLGCLDPGVPPVATTLLDRHTVNFSPNERALLRSAAVLVRSGRRSFYSTFLPEGEEYLRFDVGCMEAVDDRGREAIRMLEDRLAQSSPVEHHWQTGEILVIDNWRALHGRARTGVAVGRRLLRIMIDG